VSYSSSTETAWHTAWAAAFGSTPDANTGVKYRVTVLGVSRYLAPPSHANRSRAILDAIWENYLDANWTQIRNAIPTASLENSQIRLNHTENSEAL
jgi:hypothetical protein